jgi:diguanylate cyclase (GGDEF)-like protein/PAS domain S-box-containing protein
MFRKIGTKLIIIFGSVIALALIAIVGFYADEQERNILAQNERVMRKVAESVSEGLQTVMIAGYADVAQIFSDRLKDVAEVRDFRILRIDGTEAFRDNATISNVNTRRGREDFTEREKEETITVLQPADPNLAHVLNDREIHFYYEDIDGERHLTYLSPILSEKTCQKCHGSAQPVRGLLKITTSLASVREDIQATRSLALTILVLSVAAILLLTGWLLRHSVVLPIKLVSRAMRQVSGGRLDKQVPIVGGDELGKLANNFNMMTAELLETYSGFEKERGKLSTIIQEVREGMIAANDKDEIVLVNPAVRLLLGKTEEEIRQGGLLGVLDDPVKMAERLDGAPAGQDNEAEVVTYNGLHLAVFVSRIRNSAGQLIGSAVLLRDITEETRLESELRALSTTDGLTGLFNRRHLDSSLAQEVERAKRNPLNLSIMMFDIDHFKKFNDTHGHDQGDRVLKAVADCMRLAVRNIDIPCRYGGEEFLIIMPETDQPGGAILAERLRKRIEDMVVDGLKVTVSIGVAGIVETGVESAPDLVQAADEALYRAKKGGRNQVLTAQTSIQSQAS